jgi:hypothetical protein
MVIEPIIHLSQVMVFFSSLLSFVSPALLLCRLGRPCLRLRLVHTAGIILRCGKPNCTYSITLLDKCQ